MDRHIWTVSGATRASKNAVMSPFSYDLALGGPTDPMGHCYVIANFTHYYRPKVCSSHDQGWYSRKGLARF